MRKYRRTTISIALAIGFLAAGVPADAKDNLLFILDGSGSMYGKVDGVAKIVTAKETLSKLIGDLPPDMNVALASYGHRRKKDCTDIQLLSGFDQSDRNEVVSAVAGITPLGKTPIADALEKSASAFPKGEGHNNQIVLISDGIETCKGEPCAVAGKLAASRIKLKVHVVGFDISEKDRKQLECIAELGKGKYFPADSTEGFKGAVTEAVKVAQAPPPPAPEPEQAPPPPPAPHTPAATAMEGRLRR